MTLEVRRAGRLLRGRVKYRLLEVVQWTGGAPVYARVLDSSEFWLYPNMDQLVGPHWYVAWQISGKGLRADVLIPGEVRRKLEAKTRHVLPPTRAFKDVSGANYGGMRMVKEAWGDPSRFRPWRIKSVLPAVELTP